MKLNPNVNNVHLHWLSTNVVKMSCRNRKRFCDNFDWTILHSPFLSIARFLYFLAATKQEVFIIRCAFKFGLFTIIQLMHFRFHFHFKCKWKFCRFFDCCIDRLPPKNLTCAWTKCAISATKRKKEKRNLKNWDQVQSHAVTWVIQVFCNKLINWNSSLWDDVKAEEKRYFLSLNFSIIVHLKSTHYILIRVYPSWLALSFQSSSLNAIVILCA